MKLLFLLGLAVVLFLLAACAPLNPQRSIYPGRQEATVVFYPTDSNNLLSCLEESKSLKRKEFSDVFLSVSDTVQQGGDADQLRFICLSLHKHASYKDFKKGLGVLSGYIKKHPDEKKSLSGFQMLVQRLHQEKISRWAQTNSKEILEEENKQLLDKIAALENAAEQDKVRVLELQNQIEQLKNIENIIKNREQ